MKITVSKSELFSKLKILGKVIQAKNTLPAYDDFLFVMDKDGILTVTAAEEGGRITTNIDCYSDFKDSRFTINAKTILEALKEIPEQPLIIDISPNDKCVEMVCAYSNGKFSIVGQLGNDYPEMLFVQPSKPIILQTADFLHGIRQVKMCCANDQLRPVMNGVYFDRNLDSISYVATDGTVLAVLEYPATHVSDRNSFIIPSRFAGILSNIIPADCEEITITIASNNACFEFDNFRLTCRLIEGRYPNYNAVIPKGNDKLAVIATDEVISALKRTSVFTNPNTMAIKLSFSDQLLIQVQNLDYSTSAEEVIPLDSYRGGHINMGFNSTHLIELLSNIPSEKVCISMKEANLAAVLTPAVESGSKFLCIIMPISTNF
ncbi:DNA polymerase III subunit beta [uncultured Bacteroides sp.]|uniref:DNA polymerase III subunit beta n=1 Tax=uncultured Bacteroides sp. TaxID=162156 RepID=UPI0025F8448A|nr:DNA polymerase III subunit beta [uncultured Bacteroides sp.]